MDQPPLVGAELGFALRRQKFSQLCFFVLRSRKSGGKRIAQVAVVGIQAVEVLAGQLQHICARAPQQHAVHFHRALRVAAGQRALPFAFLLAAGQDRAQCGGKGRVVVVESGHAAAVLGRVRVLAGFAEADVDLLVEAFDQGGDVEAVRTAALAVQAALCQCARVVEIGGQGIKVLVVQVPILRVFPAPGHFVDTVQAEVCFRNKGRGRGEVGDDDSVHRMVQRGQAAQFVLIFAAPGLVIEPPAAEAAGQPALDREDKLAAVFGGRFEVALEITAQILGDIARVIDVAGFPFIQQAGFVQIRQQQVLMLAPADLFLRRQLVDPLYKGFAAGRVSQVFQRHALAFHAVFLCKNKGLVVQGVVQNQRKRHNMVNFDKGIARVQHGLFVRELSAAVQALPALQFGQAVALEHAAADPGEVCKAHDFSDFFAFSLGGRLVLFYAAFDLRTLGIGAAQLTGHFKVDGPGRTIPRHHSVDDLARFVQAARHHRVFGEVGVFGERRQLDTGPRSARRRAAALFRQQPRLEIAVAFTGQKGVDGVPHILFADLGRAGKMQLRQLFDKVFLYGGIR